MTTQFSWLSYLDVAEHLARQREQGFYRSAISRAYYGVLCHARDTLQPFRDTPFSSRGDVHQQVIDALKSDPRPGVADLGERLHRLYKERNRADYRTSAQFARTRVQGVLATARRIESGIRASFP